MEKNLMISIMIDGVQLKEIEHIQTSLEELFKIYPDKRITISIQDQPLVQFR